MTERLLRAGLKRWGRHLSLLGLVLGLAVAGSGCRKTVQIPLAPTAPPTPPWLEDVTEKVGLNFVHDVGPIGTYFMPEQVGSGAAIFDFDGDGRMDVFLLQNAGTNSTARHQLFQQE